jgi:D-3-phosphoglycerate dehydrogenase
VKQALQGEFVPEAVNVQAGGMVAEEVRPGLGLTEKLGRVLLAVTGGLPASVEVVVAGEIAAYDVQILKLSALKGIFTDVIEEQVSFVNAPIFAEQRGLDMQLTTTPDSPDYRNLITLRAVMATGETHSVSGTLTGPKQVEKLTEIDGFDIEIVPATHMAFLRYGDRPGVVGSVGRVLGDANVNIAGMQVARTSVGGETLMVLVVDDVIPAETLAAIANEIGASSARTADLVES